MEFANVWQKNGYISQVRVAEKEDSSAITQLLRRASYVHIHADWRLPAEWLGTPGFVVLPEPDYEKENGRSPINNFLLPRTGLRGCLAATADPPPSAWVRVAAVGESRDMLAAMLARVSGFLRETAVTELCWLATRTWPDAWLPDLGFFQANAIETYMKDDVWLPEVTAVPNLTIRPAELADMAALERIEKAAFEPMWRHSAETFELASHQALCFDVAELNGEIMAFQLSTRTDRGAHLVRLTIDPRVQRQGIGSAILDHAIRTYHRLGLRQVSLNTQIDNISSQFLYKKFGFQATGQHFPVWLLPL
ncbi:MAG: GNAT family N-acetyltransferase [Ardenticatenaceae bacterium]|nr:GNAT family N-acetyltransferase [Ardenticatenaceae bacterium]MCB9444500.1 GNAT family N-acetyltransferase [Ardenticatenaceae bacterium]